ncbi:MAG: FadR family transcriptional regulator [Lawsonibacter sp.]|nr:FadR family transcriptional regulator [Lawsonibacter sp.]
MPSIERINATSQVVNSIRAMIRKGELKVGDKLPKEADLAREIGVGRSSLREGMKILAAYGVVEPRQGEGTFIVDNTAQCISEFMGFFPDKENLDNFIELRRVIEVGNIISIYNQLDPVTIKTLEKTVAALKEDRSVDDYVAADMEFHSILLSYTGNPMLRQINIMIEAMRKDLLYRLFCHREILEDAYTAHTEILAALKAQDFNGCVAAVVGHIDTTKDHTRKIAREYR